MTTKHETCSICGGRNEPWPDKDGKIMGYGNNAQPVNDGRCCETCDITVVIPTRIGRLTVRTKP